MFEAMELLHGNGHETALFSMLDPQGEPTPYGSYFMPHVDFKNQTGWFGRAKLAGRVIYSVEARRRIRAMIAEFRPDVAHVRNIYHHLSPSILWELRAQHVPVLYHLNDFKALCPSYNFVSQGEACEACKSGKFWHVLAEKCYPGFGSRLTLTAEAYFHKWLGTYRKCVDCFLAPSQFVRDKFVEHGWDAARFEILPHFQSVLLQTTKPADDAPLLYFGRLSAEKGVEDLIWAMARLPHLRLVVAGDGPERSNLMMLVVKLGLGNVDFIGHVKGERLNAAIAESRFTVLPSHAYETFGKTILESYARGRTVIASDLGSRRELVHEGKTGLLYPVGNVDRLTSAIEFLCERPELAEEMGRTGQESLRARHTSQQHYEFLMGLYERLVCCKKSIRHGLSRAVPRETDFSTSLPGIRRLDLSNRVQRVGKGLTLPTTVKSGESVSGSVRQGNQLRVAFIGGRGVIGKYSGIETYYEEVGSRLAEMGHEITAYCRSYFTKPARTYRGIKILRLPTIRSKHLETLLHTFLSTLHVVTQQCDVVHYHALGPALFSFIPRLAGKQTVVTVQGLDWQRKKWGRFASMVLRWGERAAAFFPCRTIVVTSTLRDYYRERYGVEAACVPNGGLLRERRLPDKVFDWGLEPKNYILFLGRFSPEKGCHLLVDAYERLDTTAKLVMAGTSSYCERYRREIENHASDRIKILDAVAGSDLEELLTNAMLFVLPSDLEGLSLALLDAMGAGLCVLTSDVPENREVVDGVGFTFRRGDVNDLAERLRFLIANPAVRESAGKTARRRVVEQYHWAKVARETERVYFQAMGWIPGEIPKKPSKSVQSSVQVERKAG
jgi:glycosyltransferase involved in cell wall biosynthesis